MRSSESDTENECFESAEESLDENEELKNVEIKSKKSLGSSERKVAEPALSHVDSDSDDCGHSEIKEEKQSRSSSSLSFRKRPERVKRMPSKTLSRSTSKSPTREGIFKTDKIVPDVFFQDITTNLSKNINKSLSTLQKKSSNVKDLIFSSFPSSGNETEGFSYDDKTTVTPLDKCSSSDVGPDSQNVSQSVLSVDDKNTKNKEEEVESSIIHSSVDRHSEIDKGEPPDLVPDNSEEKFQGGADMSEGAADDKGDICNFPKEKLEISTSDSLINKDNYFNTEKVPEEKSFKNSSEEISETKIDQEVTSSEEISKTGSVSLPKSNNEENQSFTEPQLQTEENISNFETNLEENVDEKNSVTTVASDLVINDDNNVNKVEEVSEAEFKCNLTELKTALKNIVEEDKINVKDDSSSNNNNNKNNNEPLKEELTPEEKINEVEETSKDGWDDFDFSDNEVEDITTNKSTNIIEEKDNSIDDKVKDKKSGPEIKNKEVETKKLEESVAQHETANKKAKESGKESQVQQTAAADDGWDNWDNWDEPEGKEGEMDIPTHQESKTKNIKESESSDVSKWSGWDTFGQKPQEKQGNWGLGSWGVDMLLNKATAVTQGISNVLEAGLGAPDPETLARMEKIEREKWKEEGGERNETENEECQGEVVKKNSLTNVNLFPVAGLTSLVAGVTSQILEHSKIQEIGSKVITGGLDTLETFGKKTMEVLQEGDPGLKNKRALLLGNNKPVLSQVLREAREKAERESKRAEEKELAKKCHFETLFDDFQGMIHLEALEMLSTQCELKLDQIKSEMNSEEQEDLNGTLEEVEQLCSLDDCDMDLSSMLDFKRALQMAIEPLKNEISINRIVQIHEDVCKWLQRSEETEPSYVVVNQKLVATLAEFTAAIVQQFHRSGELLSVKECRKTVEEVDALSRLTNILCMEIKRIVEKFATLSKKTISNDSESHTEKATVVMENSTSYIRQAFDLLIPVLQLGAAV